MLRDVTKVSPSNIASVLKVSEFLSTNTYFEGRNLEGKCLAEKGTEEKRLKIPFYQRPYCWKEENITDLFSDLFYQTKRLGHIAGSVFNPDNAYRLGTVVLHQQEGGDLALVDGQQRTLTLLLILNVAKENKFRDYLKNYQAVDISLPNCSETQENLSANHGVIGRYVNSPEFTIDVLDLLLNHCEIVQVTLNDLSEAFQFFDSQNARGLDLSPHDLLKAFHLREFPDTENDLKQIIVEDWERQNTKRLKSLFANYLYPIRRWSSGQPAMYFSKTYVGVFKGINVNDNAYPFQQGTSVIHNTVDNYNQHFHRKLDQHCMLYPFQLTQTIINGRRFFGWVEYYQALLTPLLESAIADNDESWLNDALRLGRRVEQGASTRPTAFTIMKTLTEPGSYDYSGWWRQGDKYVRRLFDSLLLCYYDRFGNAELERAIEYIFIWAYALRLTKTAVYVESIEKHVRENNLFMRLQHSLSPADFLSKRLPLVKERDDQKSGKVKGIRRLHRGLGYYLPEQNKDATHES
tara:strand:+ start:1156 stop:2715 length:1560 start_codon:yes stop_codon:yes gene_type:complete